MKFNQVLSVVFISGLTTAAVLFGYHKLTTKPASVQSLSGQVPSNYVGLFDSNNSIPGQAVAVSQYPESDFSGRLLLYPGR